MTKKEYYQKRNSSDASLKPFFKNRQAAYKFYEKTIEAMKLVRPGVKIVLHHTKLDDENYELWENVVPMYQDDHMRFHRYLARGEKMSKTIRKKMSESHKKKCICVETGEIFNSVEEAEKSVGASSGSITNSINRPERFKTCKGYTWKMVKKVEVA